LCNLRHSSRRCSNKRRSNKRRSSQPQAAQQQPAQQQPAQQQPAQQQVAQQQAAQQQLAQQQQAAQQQPAQQQAWQQFVAAEQLAAFQRDIIRASLPFPNQAALNRYANQHRAKRQARTAWSRRLNAPGIERWWNLLDPSRTKFDYHHDPNGFDSLEDAADVFRTLIPSEDFLRKSFNRVHHGLLTTDTDDADGFAIPEAAEVVADLYSDDNGAPEWQHYVSCLLTTKSAWNPDLSLGELIVIAFVHIFTTCIHIKRQSLFEQ
jgi:hypothetical protein